MLYLLMLLYLGFGFRERGKGIKGGCEGRFGESEAQIWGRNSAKLGKLCLFMQFFILVESDEVLLLLSSIQQNTV